MSRLGPQHFQLYRLLHASSTPGAGGRPICPYGQAKLAARLGVSTRTIRRLIADLREPGIDPRHPDAAPSGLRLGWLQVLPRECPGGRGGTLYGGDRYVLQVDLDQLARLEAQAVENPPQQVEQPASPVEPVSPGQIEGTSHLRRSDRRDTPETPVPPGQIEGTSRPVSLRRYVRSSVATEGEPVAERGIGGSGGEGGETQLAVTSPAHELELQQQPRTNNGLRRWVPAEEYVPRRAREIARTEGVGNAERYLDAVRRNDERRERMRAAGQHAQAVQAAEHPDGSEPAIGGYGQWVPEWAEGGPPLQAAPDPDPPCEDCPEEAAG